jgi:hypothetical protein
MTHSRTASEALSGVRLSGREIEDLRLLFAGPDVGLRSTHSGIVASGLFARIERPDELRCGPVYVSAPSHDGTGYEIDDRHMAAVRQYAMLRRAAGAAHGAAPGCLDVLRAAYVSPRLLSLSAFDREPGDHGTRLSAVLAAWPAEFSPRGMAGLERLSARAGRPNESERQAIEAVLAQAGGWVAEASRAWRGGWREVRRG